VVKVVCARFLVGRNVVPSLRFTKAFSRTQQRNEQYCEEGYYTDTTW